MRLNKQIFGWLGASALLLTAASCTNEPLTEPQNEAVAGEVYGNGNGVVTLNINAQNSVGTRDISDGSQALSLYFEVYDLGKTSELSEDKTPEISKNSTLWATNVPVTEDTTTTDPSDPSDPSEDTPMALADGDEDVTVISKPIVVSNYQATIRLAVDPEHSYRIALWAQKDSDSDYNSPFTFKSNPFTVNVNYTKNNIEEMDAFCAIYDFAGSTRNIDVVLHRPFAQLNVGTTGADYNNYKEGSIYPNRTITLSQVVVDDIYSAFDVANDKVTGEAGKQTLAFNKTIAEQTKENGEEEYLNIKLNDNSITSIKYWDAKAHLVKDAEKAGLFFKYKEDYPTVRLYSELTKKVNDWVKLTKDEYTSQVSNKTYGTDYIWVASFDKLAEISNPKNGFLVNVGGVDFYKYQQDITGSVNTEYTVEQGEDPTIYLTEQFKYMSMCYVLVKDDKGDDWSGLKNKDGHIESDVFKSSTLKSVDVYFAEDNEAHAHQYFTVNNVPVHRNWRTNLIGGLADPDPDDPNGPDDDTSLFYNTRIAVYLCPIYYGEFNGSNNNDKSNTNHFDEIWGGWFDTTGNDMHQYPHHPKTEQNGGE